MADIDRIDVRVRTASGGGDPGTDDGVYLGLGGREFHLDTSSNDHESGSTRIFRLGDSSNVTSASRNDPRNPQLGTIGDLPVFPVYIRKAGPTRGDEDDAWRVESVRVTVNPGPSEIQYSRLFRSGHRLWLSNESGRVVYLKPGESN